MARGLVSSVNERENRGTSLSGLPKTKEFSKTWDFKLKLGNSCANWIELVTPDSRKHVGRWVVS